MKWNEADKERVCSAACSKSGVSIIEIIAAADHSAC